MTTAGFSCKVVRKSGKRSATITVGPDDQIILSVPKNFPESMVQEVIQRQDAWIRKRLLLNEVFRKKYPPKSYLPGDQFSFLGKNYALELFEAPKRRIEMTEVSLKVYAEPESLYGAGEDGLPSMIQAWYEGMAQRVLAERVSFYEMQMNLKSGPLEVKTIRSFWGSCGSDGYLRFNSRLLMASIEVVDYVVVHELSHMRHRNHSKSFWREVESVLPDYHLRRNWLTKHGRFLTF